MDPNIHPWKSMIQKGTKPVNDNCQDEIMWHWVTFVKAYGIVKKEAKPKAWKVDQVNKWLDDHPIIAAANIAFLLAAVAH